MIQCLEARGPYVVPPQADHPKITHGALRGDILEILTVSQATDRLQIKLELIKHAGVPLLDLATELKEEAGAKERLLSIIQPIMEDDATSWEAEIHNSHDLSLFAQLPDDVTLQSLLKLYIRHVAPFWPIIHRATFEVQCADRLHQRLP